MPADSTQTELELPGETEARCYLCYHSDGMTQSEIAELVGRDQSTVARMIERVEEMIEAAKQSGRFDANEIELLLQKLTGRAAHGRRLI